MQNFLRSREDPLYMTTVLLSASSTTLTSSKWYFGPHEVQINMDLRAVQCLVIRTTAGLPQSTGIACMLQGLDHWRVGLEDVDLTFNVVRRR